MREVGLQPTMRILVELADGDDWQAVEREQIARHRESGCRLTNLTGGGDGFHDLHPEIRERLVRMNKERLSDPVQRAAHIQRLRAAKERPEVRQAMAEGVAYAWKANRDAFIRGMAAPEARARRAGATRQRFAKETERAAHSARMKEVAKRPEAIAQITAASRKRWADYRAANPPPPPLTAEQLAAKQEATREKQRLSALARSADPEKSARIYEARWTPEKRAAQAAQIESRREKMIAGVTPEGRARQAEAMRRIWAERKAAK